MKYFFILFLFLFPVISYATYIPPSENNNIGIGTTIISNNAVSVLKGNVGIGTWVPRDALDIKLANHFAIENGNLGIGTINPITKLHVQSGSSGITYTPSVPAVATFESNNALGTAIDIIGNSTAGNYDGISPSKPNAVGWAQFHILSNNSWLSYVATASTEWTSDPNGNLGIGTAASANQLDIGGNYGVSNDNAAMSVGTLVTYLTTKAVLGGMNVQNNVGIGSQGPGQILDVQGTLRATGFTLSGNGATSGYLLESDNVGTGTWSTAASVISGWSTIHTNDVYETNGGNVGIGTTMTNVGASLTVMNGNLGIGTWNPRNYFQLKGTPTATANNFYINPDGNVGMGTVNPTVPFMISTNTASDIQNQFIGGMLDHTQYAGAANITGGEIDSVYNPGSSINTLEYGVSASTILTGASSANSNRTTGLISLMDNIAGGAMTTAINFETKNCSNTGSGSITNCYGYYADDQTGGASNFGFYDATTSGSKHWGFYANGSAPNYFNGNVGIGSSVPGELLDVHGTLRATFFMLTTNPGSGDVLESNSVGIGTWMAISTLSGTVNNGTANQVSYYTGATTLSGNNNLESDGTNVGIGTTFTNAGAALSVMNGNVGIGTWGPTKPFSVKGDMYSGGNIGIGTTFVDTADGPNLMVMNGNVGIGTVIPNAPLNFVGGVGGHDFVTYPISGQAAWHINGASDAFNIATNAATAPVIINPNGQVGLGTANTNAAFMVMNGNVGIGTWAPGNSLDVVGGNIGISTTTSIIELYSGTNLMSMRKDTSSIYAGYTAGNVTTAGSMNNAAFGFQSLGAKHTGNFNTGFGFATDNDDNAASKNTSVGPNVLSDNATSAANDAGVGYNAIGNLSSGSNIIALGNGAGFTIADGSTANETSGNSLYIGQGVNAFADGDTNETVIGYSATGLGSNSVLLGNSTVKKTELFSNVGINTASPSSQLVVNGGMGIGTSLTNGNYLNGTSAPTGGLIVQGNVGLGTYIVTAGHIQGPHNTSAQGQIMCWGTNNCLGYCTVGVWPACSTCTCI